jgi:hypothetical protein
MQYVPALWYWTVANQPNLVFSAPSSAYVDPATDQGYLDFTNAGNAATSIVSDGELADVLTRAGMSAALIYAAGWADWGGVPPLDRVAVLMAAGLAIVSTGTPALNATYAIDDAMRVSINANVSYIQTYSAFPAGVATKDWPDIDGTIHTFPTTGDYLNFARAVADYVAAVNDWGITGGTAGPPSQPITIA